MILHIVTDCIVEVEPSAKKLYVLTFNGRVLAPLGERVAAYISYGHAARAMSSWAGKKTFKRWQEGRFGNYEDLYNEEISKLKIMTIPFVEEPRYDE